jgi:signal transduction histidine kinase
LVSLLSVPLVVGGQALGVLNVYSSEPHTFSNEEIETLSALAELSAIALERARLAERMGIAEEQMRHTDKLCALGLLAAEVAHEIRNPLTVMKMLYHSLDLQFPSGDPRQEDARLMGQKMDQLNRIVEQVLDFARHAEPRFEAVSVPALLEDLRLLTRHKLRAHEVELRLETGAEPVSLRGDRGQLEQAFLNLMLNAVDAMPRGGCLTVGCAPAMLEDGRSGLVMTFSDNGPGLPGDFEARRGRLLGSTKPQGSGLGLAVVERVVEAHRGRLEFRSVPGQGTTVEIRLPVDPTE